MSQPDVTTLRAAVDDIIHRIRPDFHGEIRDGDRLREDIGLDSLHSMELLSAVTEKYEIDVDIEEVQEVKTVGDVVAFLKTALG
ncbi:MAG: acyl carrier protein [Polyangiaceae bacterium]|jgi:acyl carrier protein|nr:acyl carrier protein [Polyangiaceae bacterium]